MTSFNLQSRSVVARNAGFGAWLRMSFLPSMSICATVVHFSDLFLGDGFAGRGRDLLADDIVTLGLFVLLGIQHVHNLVCVAALSRLEQGRHIHRELDSVAGRARPEVILPGFEPAAPRVEMHRGHPLILRVLLIEIQTLRLADVRSAGRSHVQAHPL